VTIPTLSLVGFALTFAFLLFAVLEPAALLEEGDENPIDLEESHA
jgi:hypothetical protein